MRAGAGKPAGRSRLALSRGSRGFLVSVPPNSFPTMVRASLITYITGALDFTFMLLSESHNRDMPASSESTLVDGVQRAGQSPGHTHKQRPKCKHHGLNGDGLCTWLERFT
jgi:hypothetical protein